MCEIGILTQGDIHDLKKIDAILLPYRAPRKRQKIAALAKIEKLPYLKQLSEVVRPVFSIFLKDFTLLRYLQFCLAF